MKRTLQLSVLLALGGCAATYTEPTLPTDHPANAGAAESPPASASRTLDLATTEPVAPAQASAGVEHSGHDKGGAPKPEVPMPGMEGGAHKQETPGPPVTPKPDGAATVLYACPMHPEVTSDKPDQRCSKCGMKLKKQEGGEEP